MSGDVSNRSYDVAVFRRVDYDDIAELLMNRLEEAVRIMPCGWIFLTPWVTILSQTKSSEFLLKCLKEERRWIRHAQKVFGRFAVCSPKNWVSQLPDDSSRSKTQRNNFLHWTLHCRGNLFFAPGSNGTKSGMPDEQWRKEVHASMRRDAPGSCSSS
ncbi:MAG: hypothetical protein Aurels2KO_55540 [Aureliella sp.]